MADTFRNRETPGVYITELSAFPPSIIGVQTAVPAFIGYTEKAEVNGKPVLNQPVEITSMTDFESYFGGAYSAPYGFAAVTDQTLINQGKYDFIAIGAPTQSYYNLTAPALRFNLHPSMKLFFANGGGTCYVVSVGNYASAPTQEALLAGLQAIQMQLGPTMLVAPDAVQLPPTNANAPNVSADFQAVVRAMLQQSATLQDRIAVLDVYGTTLIGTTMPSGSAATLESIIAQLHQDAGDSGLSYGAAYFPFLATTILDDFDFTSLSPVDDSTASIDLKRLLTWANNAYNKQGSVQQAVQEAIDSMKAVAATNDAAKITTLTQQLMSSLPLMSQMLSIVDQRSNVMPPSGALAGVMTYTDQARGVWNAPANINLNSVTSTTFTLNDKQQGELNVPLDGKAVNAIRDFPNRGTVVWGARTLDGNSNDYRYLQVRRTLIYIQQSIKLALQPFTFAPNDGRTWVSVTAMITNFLTSVWSQGGLMGAKASDAFSVQCGLGSTMTSQNILDGYMIVQVTLQMVHPAEFIELTFTQIMQGV